MPYVDKVKSVKNTGVSQPRWAIWREIWKWSCIPSLLYCISRKNVDTEYTYYSWCMTSTDIVKWRKNEWLWKFWKRNDLYENLKKGGIVEKRGEEETKSMPQVPVVPNILNIWWQLILIRSQIIIWSYLCDQNWWNIIKKK